MLITDQYLHNKSIFVSVLGCPNAGKSSLINYFLGFDLSIVTDKPQTTRHRINCVANIDHTEIVFVDTPGIHTSGQEINIRMNGQAKEGCMGSDLNLLLIDLSRDVTRQVTEFKRNFEGELKETWVVFTKFDLVEEKVNLDDIPAIIEVLKQYIPTIEKHFVLSVKEETNMHELTGALLDKAPNAPHIYPNGEVSNKSERFFATEYIREQAFELLKEEVPYELAVMIDDYQDSFDKDTKQRNFSDISATILVNRPSQRAIVVGAKGSNIKQIGTLSRQKIEKMNGSRVNLNLHVKVAPKWFNNNKILEEVGLPRVQSSKRVWKQR